MNQPKARITDKLEIVMACTTNIAYGVFQSKNSLLRPYSLQCFFVRNDFNGDI